MTILKGFLEPRPDEKVIHVIRKHPIVYFRLILIFLITSVVPLTIFLVLWSNHFPFSTTSQLGILGYIGASFFALYSLAVFFVAWINEEFDIYILSNQRLIDITQVNFFKRTVSETQLRNIEDTKAEITGIFGTIFNYGNLEVQTAAGDPNEFFMDHVHHPAAVGGEIMDAVHESFKKHTKAVSQGVEHPDLNVIKGKL